MMAIRRLAAVLVLAAALVGWTHGATRAETVLVVDTAFPGASLDLAPNLDSLESAQPGAIVLLPPDDNGVRAQMPLEAARPDRPLHRWRILHLKNSGQAPADLLLAIPHRQFSGSGVFWPSPSGSQVTSVQLSVAELVRPARAAGFDVLAMALSSGAALTHALELNGQTLNGATLWKSAAWEARSQARSFFNGAVLGIGVLLAVAAVALFILRRRAAFPASALFTLASVAFLALNMGYLAPLVPALTGLGLSLDTVRAAVETEMTIGAALLLLTLLDVRSRSPLAASILYVAIGAALALAALALLSPAVAIGVNRLLFCALAAGGLALVIALRSSALKTQVALLVWPALSVWTVIAALDAGGLLPGSGVSPLTSATLTLALLALAVSTSQLAIGPKLAVRRSMDEMARRALALANSEQSVWDWQIDRQALNVGAELERAIGLSPGAIALGGMASWNEAIHPADRGAFAAALDAARRRRRGGLSLEFRLRRADGSYRWYNLRGRVIPGESGEAERIVGAIGDVTALRRAEDRLLFDAVRDRVTSLPNRPLFLDRLERAMRAQPLGVYCMVIDIDRFRSVNDSLGHEVGDSLLHVTARRLSTLTGPDDTLARLSGDQFGLVVHATRATEALALARDVRAAVSEPVRIRGQDIFLTGSIGMASGEHAEGGAEDMLRDAEIALYEAKRRGKDMAEMFRPAMRETRLALASMEQELAQAAEKGEIEVVYQPIVRVADGQLAGFEALARWRRATGDVVEPSRFIAVAEETGAIRAVGRFVLAQAAHQLGVWQRAFRPSDPLFVAVNVSSRQLIGNELVDDLKAIVAREDVRPGTLKIEITESIVMQNPELSSRVLQRLRALGVGVACDDFGTGYSSLANLRRLPFDTLKVDRSFIDVDMDDEQAAIVLESIVLLAHDLGLSVVAEGVENAAQMGRLVEFECDFAQGFHIGEPASAAEVTEALGGTPYRPARRGGMSGWWDRVTGRRAPAPGAPAAVAPPPSAAPFSGPDPSLDSPPEPRSPAEATATPPVGASPMAPRLPPGRAPMAPQPAGRVVGREQPAPPPVGEAEPPAALDHPPAGAAPPDAAMAAAKPAPAPRRRVSRKASTPGKRARRKTPE